MARGINPLNSGCLLGGGYVNEFRRDPPPGKSLQFEQFFCIKIVLHFNFFQVERGTPQKNLIKLQETAAADGGGELSPLEYDFYFLEISEKIQ